MEPEGERDEMCSLSPERRRKERDASEKSENEF
jgi:hypothetical protein